MNIFQSKNKNALFLFSLFAAIALFSYAFYSIRISFDVPRGDHWRWLKYALIPFTEGNKSFFSYITYEFHPFSHSHILTLFNVFLNYNFFALDYRIESYIGLICAILIAIIIVKTYFSSTKFESKNAQLLFAAGIISIVLNPRNVNSWTLVQFEYIYLLLSIIFFKIFLLSLKNRKYLPAYYLSIPILFFLGDAIGICAILSVITFLICFNTMKNKWKLLSTLCLIYLSFLLSQIIFPNTHPHTNISKIAAIQYVIGHPIDSFHFLTIAFSQSIVEKASLIHFFPKRWLLIQNIVGLFAFFLFGFAIATKFFNRRYKNDLSFPLLLIGFTLFSFLGIMLTRFPSLGVDVAQSGRYIRSFQIGLVGVLWVLSSLATKAFPEKIKKRSSPPILFINIFLICCFFLHSAFLWKYYPSIIKYKKNKVNSYVVYSNDFSYDIGKVEPRCKDNFCKDPIVFLKTNKLSFFKTSQQ